MISTNQLTQERTLESPGTDHRRRNHNTHFIDGLRAAAALFVVFHHCWLEAENRIPHPHFPNWIEPFGKLLSGGGVAVDVFIVVSGFCLALPVAASADLPLRGGNWGFFARRARRILPPYYAALLLSLLLIVAVPALHHGFGDQYDISLPAFTFPVIISHIFLVENLSRDWIFKINQPMWSIAVESQIYLFFPLLLLVSRKYGPLVTVGVGIVAGMLLVKLGTSTYHLQREHLLGLFAMGMAAAIFSRRKSEVQHIAVKRAPWGVLALALLLIGSGIYVLKPEWTSAHFFAVDPIVGAGAAALIVYCDLHANGAKGSVPRILKLLQWPPLVALGAFSYSLYLTHDMILFCVSAFLKQHHASGVLAFLVLCASVPAILAFSYLFHVIFERPFMTKRAVSQN